MTTFRLFLTFQIHDIRPQCRAQARLEPAAELTVPVALLQSHSSRGRLHRCEHRWIALQLATELRESLAQQLQRPASVPLDEPIRGMPPQGRRHGLGVDPGLQLPQGLRGLAQQQAAQRAGGFPGRVGLSTSKRTPKQNNNPTREWRKRWSGENGSGVIGCKQMLGPFEKTGPIL